MIKRFALMAFLAVLLIPAPAWADSIDFGFTGGTVSGDSLGLTGSSTLTSTSVLPSGTSFAAALPTGLGSVSIVTGALISGTLGSGGTFSSVGSSITITANGTWGGIPAGTIYSGSFNTDITWAQVGSAYTLSGGLFGTASNALIAALFPSGCTGCGGPGDGALVSLTVAGSVPFSGSAGITSGNVTHVVPEPGTLALFGSGLLGIAGLIRRRLSA